MLQWSKNNFTFLKKRQLSIFCKIILLFLSLIGGINAHPIRQCQIGYGVRGAGQNPLILKSNLPAPIYPRICYQQKRYMWFGVPAFVTTTATALTEAITSLAIGTGLAAGLVLNSNDHASKVLKDAQEQTTQQELEMADEIRSARQSAIGYLIKTDFASSCDEEKIQRKALEILSQRQKNPYGGVIGGCQMPPQLQKPEPLINIPAEQKPEPLVNVPVKQPQSQHGCGTTEIRCPEQLINLPFERPETFGGILARSADDNKNKNVPRHVNGVKPDDRFSSTPDTKEEVYTKLKGRPGYVDKDGNIWTDDKSGHSGRHWDVMGKDGKRLKEVALDGKILSDGIKGDPNKFNSKSSDRSTRMDNPIFGRGGGSIKGNNSLASVVVGGFAIGQAVQTQAVAVLVGFPGGSRQPNGSGSATMSTAPQPNMPQMPTQGPILLTPQQMDTISSQLTPPDRFSQVQLKQEFQKAPANLSQVSGNNTQKVDIGVTLGQTIKSSNQVAPAIAQQINSNVGQSSTANTNPLAGAILVGNVASGTGAPTNMPKAISIISNQKISTAKPAPVVKPVETVVSTGYRASSSSTPQAETFLQAFERQWRQESENPTYSYQKESPAEKLQRERKQRAKERLRDLGI